MADLANALGPPAPPKTAVISSDLSMMFYGFLIIGVSVLLLSIYHFIILKLYSLNHHNRLLHYHQQHMPQPSSSGNSQSGGGTESSSGNVGNALNSISIEGNLGGKKEVKLIKHDPRKSNNGGYCGYGNDCAVCLSVFEEGEVVQQLPRCNHCFHADCIDLWLYSHLDCPLCRTPVRLQIATSSDSDDDNRNCNQSSRIQLPQVSNELP